MVAQSGAIEEARALGNEGIGGVTGEEGLARAGGGVELAGLHVEIDEFEAGDFGGFGDEIFFEDGVERVVVAGRGGFEQAGGGAFIAGAVGGDAFGGPFGERFLDLVNDAAITIDDVALIGLPGDDAGAVFFEDFLIPTGGFVPFFLALHAAGGFDVFASFGGVVDGDVLEGFAGVGGEIGWAVTIANLLLLSERHERCGERGGEQHGSG